MKRQVGLKLEDGLLGRVDAAALAAGVSRTAFFERALLAALDGTPGLTLGRGLERVVSADGGEVRRLPGRVASSASAKAGVVPRWRGGDGSA